MSGATGSTTAPDSAKESLRAVLRNKDLRRMQLAFAGSAAGDWAYAVAITVWAFQEGGATAVGVFTAVRMTASAVAGPLGATIADRMSRRTYMMVVDLARAAIVSVTAVLVMLDGPALPVYALAVVTAVVGAAFRSAQAGLVPRLVESPGQLTASNAVTANVENVMSFAGPAIGGLLIAATDVGPVIWLNAATFLWSFVLVALIKVPPRPESASTGGDDEDEEGVLREITAGFSLVARDGDLRTITLLVAAQSLLWGFLSVYLVVIAARELGTGPEGVGYFNAILGVGTVLGGILVLGRVAKGRLAQDMAVGVLGWALPLLAMAIAPTPVVALLALAVIGTSDPWVNLGFETIPQRLAPERVISRVYAAAESTAVASVAIGALLAPLALDLIGLRGALAAAGTLVGLYTLSCLPRLRGLDHRLGEPEGLPLLRGVPMMEPVAPSVLEELAHRLVPVTAAPSQIVVREGDTADRFYVIESGEVEVTRGAEVLRRESAGDYFGEIGLLRDVPRTATVTAVTETRLLALSRQDFLDAITGVGAARAAAEDIVSRRLGV
ncbi:MFS transporter [Nocardioides bigeumensis]|uniref:Cyclic nucleotide-binding domain-containing protein n=1 Tax=Nocardioides bigeumensis TaxID=433657 RepID=A0ABN2Y8N9_9ACTN